MFRIAMYSGEGTDPDPLVRYLAKYQFNVRKIGAVELQSLSKNDFDLLYLPGGWYFFDEPTCKSIYRYVESGGGCVSTCAGSYLSAGSIGLIPGRILRNNMRGRVYLEPQQGDHPILRGVVELCKRHPGRKWEPIAVTQLGGPFMLPKERSCMVASYDLEGEIGAICVNTIGKGRVVALACHPELGLADLPADDPARSDGNDRLLQGDQSLILRNAVLWALGEEVPAL